MIPKVIHYCWFGKNTHPPLVQKCLANWKKMLPDYELRLWDESNSPMSEKVVKDALKKKNFAFVSDFVRLFALYQDGGIYLDTDVEIIRSFDKLREEECFVGFSQKKYATNAVMGAMPKHFYMMDMMNFMRERAHSRQSHLTSPRVTTAVLQEYGLVNYGEQTIKGIKIMPVEAFYPYNPFDPDRPLNHFFYEDIKENTYSVHHYMASWNKATRLQQFVKFLKGKR